MTENNNNEKQKKNYFTEIFITQSVCIVIILIMILITKIFFKNEYKKIKDFYKEQICAQTSIEEVIEAD